MNELADLLDVILRDADDVAVFVSKLVLVRDMRNVQVNGCVWQVLGEAVDPTPFFLGVKPRRLDDILIHSCVYMIARTVLSYLPTYTK